MSTFLFITPTLATIVQDYQAVTVPRLVKRTTGKDGDEVAYIGLDRRLQFFLLFHRFLYYHREGAIHTTKGVSR
jgi:hypothetical protein